MFRAIRHPAVWFGALIGWLETRLNRGTDVARRLGGVAMLFVLLATATVPALALQWAAGGGFGLLLVAAAASSLPAQRSLHSFVAAVATGLERDGVAGGRRAVAHIVGRDVAALDEAGVVRAAIESLAENFSDAVVGPAVWGLVAGLAGMAGYKATNTADSVVGHRTVRFAQFGWASARLDDLLNLPASRLSAGWLIGAAMIRREDWRGAARAVWRDAGRHRSPNAGWPEAAIAGALGLRLAGPRVYDGVPVDDAWMGAGRAAATVGDLRRALRLYRAACSLQLGVIAVCAAWTL